MNKQNYGCDGGRCVNAHGEIRKLPYGNDGANMLLCRTCFNHEIVSRKLGNQRQAPEDRVPTPKWEDLEVYNTD